ncbi:thioesterase domain-containing protein [Kitasatospora sp. MAP5-34]|uniref:thioesterase II family protein n=1 Tax=Kitasatospora sp. MAP5-34 TaxID=3035102 RepID=UPI002476BEC3|nr:thioesterase domain-containing protein [Kitasatospora sp. MAP5-34]MDH6579759.1 surfactin synthase thioesterase subunit [Kitasatospora sp. MAP5-34]
MNQYLAAQPRAGAPLRLLCFHHAGAGAMTFAGWGARTGPQVSVVPVRLPGRETRLGETRITDTARLFTELDEHLGPMLDQGPYAFYGHSLGALVASRFAEHRISSGNRPPAGVVVGACMPPHLPNPLIAAHDLGDADLLAHLTALGGVPAELLARPAWLRAMLATTRADLTLGRFLREGARRPLSCPLWAFAGSRDKIATPAAVAEWERWTTASFRFHTLDGGHFFVRDAELPRLLGELLTPVAPAAAAQTPPGPAPAPRRT